MILSFPTGKKDGGTALKPGQEAAAGSGFGGNAMENGANGAGGNGAVRTGEGGAGGNGQAAEYAAAYSSGSISTEEYEKLLEERVKALLQNVDGVGKVDVMVVLKSSEEKVYRVDTNTMDSQTEEADSQGGTRKSSSSQVEENTLLTGGSSGQGGGPLVEKELKPELSGIVISAQGGGSPEIQAEISAAMEALFGLPAHKIKVLKRVD